MPDRPRFSTVLRERQFRLLWTGQSISLFGDGVLALALPLLVIETGHSDAQLGLVIAARMVPMAVLLIFGGAITDRVSRRLAMLTSDLVRGAATLALGVLAATGHLGFGWLLAGAVVLGTFDALFVPASVAMLPDIVETDLLPTANSLEKLSQTLAPLLGPIVAGLVAAKWALIIDAGTFFASACFLALMAATPAQAPSGTSMLAEIGEGLRFTRRTPWLWWSLLFAAVANALVFSPSAILVILLLVKTMDAHHLATGIVIGTASLGGGAGALVAGRRRRPTRRVATTWTAWLAADVAVLTIGVAPSPWVVAGLMFCAFAGLVYGSVIWQSLLQTEVPRSLLGRVSSVDWTVSICISPIGVALAGAVAGVIGVRPTLVIPGVAVLVVGVVVLAVVRSVTAIDRRHDAGSEGPVTTASS